MVYELVTSRGKHIQFHVRACAEVFRGIHGGVVKVIDNTVGRLDNDSYDKTFSAYEEKKAA